LTVRTLLTGDEMAVEDPNLAWDDPAWAEKSDGAWQARLRRHQAWWRHERLGLPAGPMRPGARLVSTMLPLDVDLEPNLMTPEAVSSAHRAIDSLKAEKRPGLIQIDRLKRNLLSSQPMCFNLFGHLSATPDALLPWVRTIAPLATSVTDVRLEWAPLDRFSGSAFDAFVSYALPDGAWGFVGIECKYAEDLAKAQPKPAAEKYVRATESSSSWKPGSAAALDRPKRRQFWYNQLLTQRVLGSGDFVEGYGVVVAAGADEPARAVTAEVADHLDDRDSLRFCSVEDVLESVTGHDSWRVELRERYLDF
jgi:hypothetical protein